jgi:hypothetical protein
MIALFQKLVFPVALVDGLVWNKAIGLRFNSVQT